MTDQKAAAIYVKGTLMRSLIRTHENKHTSISMFLEPLSKGKRSEIATENSQLYNELFFHKPEAVQVELKE